jgi:hypothetical protein
MACSSCVTRRLLSNAIDRDVTRSTRRRFRWSDCDRGKNCEASILQTPKTLFVTERLRKCVIDERQVRALLIKFNFRAYFLSQSGECVDFKARNGRELPSSLPARSGITEKNWKTAVDLRHLVRSPWRFLWSHWQRVRVEFKSKAVVHFYQHKASITNTPLTDNGAVHAVAINTLTVFDVVNAHPLLASSR